LPLGCELLHPANNQLEFPLQRLGLGQLVTLGFDMRNTLTQLCHARLEFLFFNEAFGIAVDEPGQALAELADLAFQGGPFLPLLLPIRVEATVELLCEPLGMREQLTDFLPHRQLQAIGPHLGVRTEAVAPKAIGIRADTPVIGIGPGTPFPGAGTQGFAVEGIATVLTLE
jgi:hypothetical protein